MKPSIQMCLRIVTKAQYNNKQYHDGNFVNCDANSIKILWKSD